MQKEHGAFAGGEDGAQRVVGGAAQPVARYRAFGHLSAHHHRRFSFLARYEFGRQGSGARRPAAFKYLTNLRRRKPLPFGEHGLVRNFGAAFAAAALHGLFASGACGALQEAVAPGALALFWLVRLGHR